MIKREKNSKKPEKNGGSLPLAAIWGSREGGRGGSTPPTPPPLLAMPA